MTVEQEVDALTTAVDNLKSTVVSKKATLDASVVDAQSATSQAQSAKTAALSARNQANASKDAALGYAASAASAVAYQDLTALAESKAVTAVDVFIYDTSKDSDGGAWRHRCTGTSWYNETLNTATRGSRREFPAVAVIVAEAGVVRIYDGDDPSLPMWMVFQGGYNNLVALGSGYFFTSVCAKNGVLVVGHKDGARAGLDVLSFISDGGKHYGTTEHPANVNYGSAAYKGNVAQRNDALGNAYVGSIGVALSNHVNDVAMTVLPDAPIDPATGLQVPTIAVGGGVAGQPNGGTYIIHNDGTVVDLIANIGAGGYATYALAFGPNNELITMQAYGGSYSHIHVFDELPTADVLDMWSVASRSYSYHTSIQVPSVTSNNNPALIELVGADSIYAGYTNRLTHLFERKADKTKGMVAYTTSNYNTGWMPGNIKGAFLSDTDDTDLVNTNLLPADILQSNTGWALKSNTTVSGGVLTIDAASDGDWYNNAKFTFPIEGGKTYRLVITVDSMTPGNDVLWIYLGGGGILVDAVSVSEPGTYEILHRSYQGATTITIEDRHNTATTFVISQLELYPAETDRSVNANGLIVNGTVTRTPVATGADLVAYSGFSASNYLEQPYSASLDFGTGNFCVMGWVKSTGSSECLIHRSITTGGIFIQITAGGVLQVYATGSTSWGTSLKGTLPVNSGTWRFVTVKRVSGVLSISVDGVQDVSAANTENLTYADAVLRVGLRRDGLEQWDNGSLALLRISATAPTAEQIAKIYNDEKVLFQEGAQATLYGTSDAVTALAHDPDTDLLHVGTSQGRSVFKGLRRVLNTTTGVGTAISAANGMVVEE